VALLLALILPVEAGYCRTMSDASCGPVADAGHGCCGETDGDAPMNAPEECPCFHRAPATKADRIAAPDPMSGPGLVLAASDPWGCRAPAAARAACDVTAQADPAERSRDAHPLRGPPVRS
jgi:hypothetical protein